VIRNLIHGFSVSKIETNSDVGRDIRIDIFRDVHEFVMWLTFSLCLGTLHYGAGAVAY
jgi:hypothetical protein